MKKFFGFLFVIALLSGGVYFGIQMLANNLIKSAEGYMASVQSTLQTSGFKDGTCTILENGNLSCNQIEVTINYDGKKATNGTITIENGVVTKVEGLIIGGKELKVGPDNKITVKEKKENGVSHSGEIKGDNSGANIPTLYDNGLIPVKYDGTDWVVADTSSEWYNYDKQEWANAVVLRKGVRKKVGAKLNLEKDVQGMFVWIPKFEYSIDGEYAGGTQESPGEIKINFIAKDKTTASDGYIIHPAFKFGNTNLAGIWYAKFEPSVSQSSKCYMKEYGKLRYNKYDDCDIVMDDIYVLPNVSPLTYQNLYNEFLTAQKFSKYVNNMDSHVSKNSEWVTAMYLAWSKYGKYGNPAYVGDAKKIMTNDTEFVTGCGSERFTPDDYTRGGCNDLYDTAVGQKASTTGNITGVYDMAGGCWEYTMAYTEGSYSTQWGGKGYKGQMHKNVSGFTSKPEDKYFDAFKLPDEYNYYDEDGDGPYNDNDLDDMKSYLRNICSISNCVGQGLDETIKWSEPVGSVWTDYMMDDLPFIIRGRWSFFNVRPDDGVKDYNTTFRLILTDN